jgi:CheY-like chemotaxis protein
MATILVVDDYAPNYRLLSFILKQHGYDVIVALNGSQALERLAETGVDLIVADLTMPKMDGITLIEHVRTDKGYQSIPVIMITASSRERDRVRALAAGVTAFLTKPIDSDELVKTIQQWVLPSGQTAGLHILSR